MDQARQPTPGSRFEPPPTGREIPPGLLRSLWTRVTEWAGPRVLGTSTGFLEGFKRQLQIPQVSQTRWLLEDLENAVIAADVGNLRWAGRLSNSLSRDGTIHGALSTRTLGLVQLPIRFRGDPEMLDAVAKDFRIVVPSSELALIDSDALKLGVGLGEFVQLPPAPPVLRRVDPEWLWYRWAEDRWYYQSVHGMIPINPGDGRWVMHFSGGVTSPWKHGLWMALGRAYIAKEHAYFYRENYNSKLANAARVAEAPQGATDQQMQNWWEQVAAWGVNSVFAARPGYTAKLLESNGVGYQTFKETISDCNEEIIITVAGQIVTTSGGTGFTNASIFEAIRSDLIQGDADALASTLNGQVLPTWADWKFGGNAGELEASWDVTPPKDQNQQAQAMIGAANAVKAMTEVLGPIQREVDVEEICKRFGVPTRQKSTMAQMMARRMRGPFRANRNELWLGTEREAA